jgi:hypothetical protein
MSQVGSATDDDPVVLVVYGFLREHRVPFVTDTLRHVTNGISRVQNNRQDLPLLHRFKLQFRFDEVIGANHSPQIQFGIRLSDLFLSVHVDLRSQLCSLEKEPTEILSGSFPGRNGGENDKRTKKRGSLSTAPSLKPLAVLVQTLDQIRLGHISPIVRLVLELGLRRNGLVAPSRLRFTIPAGCCTGKLADRR